MPSAISSSSSSVIWNSSSRGYVSRISISALWSWLPGSSPERSSTLCTFRRSSGISHGLALYTVWVKRPRKRRSDFTSPDSSNRFTPT